MDRLFWIAVFIFCSCLLMAQSVRVQRDQNQPPSVFDTPVDFNGWESDFGSLEELKEVRVGIFLSDDPDECVSQSAIHGAELATVEINAQGGYLGLPFRLVRRWESDPWRGGAKELINLVYKDSVVAIIGSTDGNSTHIAEQIVTKAWIPLLAPISADPSLNYIRIPWMFRLPPDIAAQARLIVEKCSGNLMAKNVGVVTSVDHDGRIFAQEIRHALADARLVPQFHFRLPSDRVDNNELIRRISSYEIQAVIIHLEPSDLLVLLSAWPEELNDITILIPWQPMLREKDYQQYENCNIYFVEPFFDRSSPLYRGFCKKYTKRFGEDPTAAAAYAYDALNLLKYALERSGANRLLLRNALAEKRTFRGVSGDIFFDNAGGNTSRPVLKYAGKNGEKIRAMRQTSTDFSRE